MNTSVTLTITGLPEALWAMRQEMARLLMSQADTEVSLLVAARLREIAASFEAGIGVDLDRTLND